MTPTDRARSAYEEKRAYYLATLFENPQPPTPQPRRVPAWNLEAPVRCVIECHDDGTWIWLDDPAALTS